MSKGQTHNVNVLEFQSCYMTGNMIGIFLQVTVNRQSNSNIRDEMY
jgi:hypothetical protein